MTTPAAFERISWPVRTERPVIRPMKGPADGRLETSLTRR
jgi:hypothetical protein